MDGIKRIVVVFSHHSTKAKRYHQVRDRLIATGQELGWGLREVCLDNIPYHQVIERLSPELLDGDLVIAAGGDGIAQVTFQAVYQANRAIVYGTIPLGNGNDISRAFNGRHRSARAILNQSVVDYHPLNIVVDGKLTFSLASYVTFGATTVLVDCLNQTPIRRARRTLRRLSPAASLPLNQLGKISRQIDRLEFPDFYRDGRLIRDDSIGFFTISAAHNVLRLPKDIRLARSEFFFHHAMTKGKNLGQKILMAGLWTAKLPGVLTDLEELKFTNNQVDIIANISGDNINLGPVKEMVAIRSSRPVRVLFN